MKRTVAIGTVLALDELQPRGEGIDQALVAEYAEAMGRGDPFPLIEVVEVAELGPVLTDGWHRYLAFDRLGVTRINVDVKAEGDLNTARWHAASANRRHGKRRRDGDVAAQIRLAVLAKPDATVRELASHVGCSIGYVSKVARHVEPPDAPKTSPAASLLPGRAAGSENLAPDSDTTPGGTGGSPSGDDRHPADAAIEQAERDAGPLLAAIKAAIREAQSVPDGDMKRAARYQAAELRKLAKSLRGNLLVACPKCDDVCAHCQQRGWVRARSVG